MTRRRRGVCYRDSIMHILVIDDHPVYLKGVELLLHSDAAAYDVFGVTNASQALDHVDQHQVDLILLDLNLPTIDGAGFLEALTKRQRMIPTLAMSADVDGARIQEALNNGALAFVPKSFSAERFLAAISQVAAGRSYVPSEVRYQLERRARKASSALSDATAHGITPRQLEVLQLIGKGYSNKDIGKALALTEYTVKSHVRALFMALGTKNRTACVQRAQGLGIIKSSAAEEARTTSRTAPSSSAERTGL